MTSMSYGPIAPVVALVLGRAPEKARGWFEEALAVAAAEGLDSPGFLSRWSGAGRRLGREALELTAEDGRRLRAEGAPVSPMGWGLDEAGRAALLLLAAARTPVPAQRRAIEDLYRTGEVREQQALLRTLAYLPQPASHVELAAEAVRSNVLTVLEALACDNPYPAAHMPDLAWNQLIMKALFNGLPLSRVEGLAGRRNDDLVRMVASWVGERRAAGRPVPDDVALIIGS
jgi:hypothetical protein